jgi:hypothetical protein
LQGNERECLLSTKQDPQADWPEPAPFRTSRGFFQNPINLHPRTIQDTGNCGWLFASTCQAQDFSSVDPALATLLPAKCLRTINPFTLPLLDEPVLHLRHHPKYRHQPPSHSSDKQSDCYLFAT